MAGFQFSCYKHTHICHCCSNDEYGVFGPDDAEAAKAAQQSPLLRLWNAVARFVVFTFWLTFGEAP